jgi:hypothetical protein
MHLTNMLSPDTDSIFQDDGAQVTASLILAGLRSVTFQNSIFRMTHKASLLLCLHNRRHGKNLPAHAGSIREPQMRRVSALNTHSAYNSTDCSDPCTLASASTWVSSRIAHACELKVPFNKTRSLAIVDSAIKSLPYYSLETWFLHSPNALIPHKVNIRSLLKGDLTRFFVFVMTSLTK